MKMNIKGKQPIIRLLSVSCYLLIYAFGNFPFNRLVNELDISGSTGDMIYFISSYVAFC
jgi:hypothetical protein